MYSLQIYIDGIRLTLFEDETITVNSSVQNIKDISKVFTDFTKTFNIPASKSNNKVFKHWYNSDIDNSFNAKTRKDAIIEINFKPFKKGKIQLEGAKLKNGNIVSYQITFFGNLVNLSDLFGDDKLSILPLTDLDHEYTSSNVKSGINGNLLGGNVIYPLISSERNWQFDATGTSLEPDDVKYYAGGTNGISYLELKPAIKINTIISAIESYYGVTFYNRFFNTNNHIDNLFLWLSKDKGNIKAYSDELTIFSNINYNSGILNFFTVGFTPEVGYEDVQYRVRIENSTTNESATYDFVGAVNSPPIFVNLGTGVYNIYISSIVEFKFISSYIVMAQNLIETTPVTTIVNGNTTISANLPDIKVVDFFGGLIKMFNLVIEPISDVIFNIQPLNEWYNEGSTIDVTKYIDIADVTINKPKLYKRINFNYEETETILGEKFKELNKIGYGNLESEFVYDGGTLNINIPYENIMLENLKSVLNNSFSNLLVGKIIDKDLNPTNIKPFLFYNRGITNLSSGFSFIDENDVTTEVTSYFNVGQEDNIITDNILNSLNFGEEISTYNFAYPPINSNSELGSKVSLYSNFWEDYITDLYDDKRRVQKFNAVMPLSILTKIKLNDKLIIRDKIFIINSSIINPKTMLVKLELLNYIGISAPADAGTSVLNYNLNFNV